MSRRVLGREIRLLFANYMYSLSHQLKAWWRIKNCKKCR